MTGLYLLWRFLGGFGAIGSSHVALAFTVGGISGILAAVQRHDAPKFGFLRAIEPTATTRVETFSDAVFAVAMTLLVLDLKLAPMSESISAGPHSALVFAVAV